MIDFSFFGSAQEIVDAYAEVFGELVEAGDVGESLPLFVALIAAGRKTDIGGHIRLIQTKFLA